LEHKVIDAKALANLAPPIAKPVAAVAAAAST
jgi:hypothetical protein